MQNASMPNITIRDVPPLVHEALIANALKQNQSLQQYVLGVLSEAAIRKTKPEWVAAIEARMALDPDWPTQLPNAGEHLREERDARR